MNSCPQCKQRTYTGDTFCSNCGANLQHDEEVAEQIAASTSATDSQPQIAAGGFWIRAVALTIDQIFIIILTVLVVLPLAMSGQQNSDPTQMEGLILHYTMLASNASLLISWLYFVLTESSVMQTTPGKRICKLQTTTMDGGRIGFIRANVRFVGKFISMIFPLLFLTVPFSAMKRSLHDYVAGTRVILIEK